MGEKLITELQQISEVEASTNFGAQGASQSYRVTAPQIYEFFRAFYGLMDTYDAEREYTANEYVWYQGVLYKSLVGSNENHTPSSSPSQWIPYGDHIIQNHTPAGLVNPYAGTSAPTGWLMCDGSAVSRSTYSRLYAIIGTTHGSGDGSTTFNLPDYRGRFLRGVDGSANRDPDKAGRTAMNTGGNTGNNVGSVQAEDFASHSHRAVESNSGSSLVSSSGHSIARIGTLGGGDDKYQLTQGGGTPNICNVSTAGGSETRPINAFVNYIIKT